MLKDYLADSAEAILRVDIGEISNAVLMLMDVKDRGGTVWVAGNGGSAATAEHFANDLTKIGGVRSIALPSLCASMTAFGNDNGWERMYADLLTALQRSGDVLVAISCSGNSPNVLRAAEMFPAERLIVLTGPRTDSPLALLPSGARIFVHDGDIRVQEDAHLVVCHNIAGALRC